MSHLHPQLRAGLAKAALAAALAAAGGWPASAKAAPPSSTLPPSKGLLRTLAAFERDLAELDGALRTNSAAPTRFDLADPALQAPLPAAEVPTTAAAPPRQERVLTLGQALAVAVANNPELSERRARIAEMRGLKRSVQGRFWPRLGLQLAGGFAQRSEANQVLAANAGLYPAGSPFLVQPGGWNRIQSNRGNGWGSLALDWELISFERGAALAEQDQRLAASL